MASGRGRVAAAGGWNMTLLTAVGQRAFRLAAVRRAALTAGAVRGHGLVLIFHRVVPEDAPGGLVPAVPQPLFRRMLEALLDAGEIVALEALLDPPANPRRARFALTFDDDWATHHDEVLPVLTRLGLTATFFLSGRALHRLPALWFEQLDALIAARGVRNAARLLELGAVGPDEIALACERDAALQARIEQWVDGDVRRVGSHEIRALAASGMTIGFHTLQHRVLSLLDGPAMKEAVLAGRAELEEIAGSPVRLFAYPHGRGDERAAPHLRRAGFRAAFTGRPGPIRPADDPYLLARWEPGPMELDRFVSRLGIRLNGWTGRP